MTETVIRDPDNKWYLYVDWTDWIAQQESDTGGSITINSSLWITPADITEEAETPTDDIGQFTYLIASGGTVDELYSIVNRITYTLAVATLAVTDLTQDLTVTVQLREQ